MIRGITFSEQTFYSKDFAHFQNVFLNKQNGVTKGCSVSNSDTQVTIGTGYFFVQGRLMNVEEPEVIGADKGFSEGYNRIVYEIDLSKENTITEFRQGYIKVLNSESLKQEDLDGSGKVYQFPFCHFQWSGTAITSFIADAPTLDFKSIQSQIAANYATYQKQFEEWFGVKQTEMNNWITQQHGIVDGMIQDLQQRGFEKKAVYSTSNLLAASWNKGAKTYSFESQYPAAQYNLEIQPNDTCTTEQLEAWNDAQIVGSAATNIIKAFGDVPTVNIPIIIKAVAK